jgi:hypothetical protein
MPTFDFDAWKTLADENPVEFDRRKRQALLELAAKSSPGQQPGLFALVEALCAPQPGTGLERAANAQKLMVSSMLDLQSKSIELVQAYSGYAEHSQEVALKFSRLVLT